MSRNPSLDVPMAVAFCLATVAACFVAGWRVGQLAYDHLRR